MPRRKQRVTANQVIAYNMRRGRLLRDLTQADLGDMLAKVTNRSWSVATVSAAERSFDGERFRQFDADDMLALSLVLRVPLLYFFLPPDESLTLVMRGVDGEVVPWDLYMNTMLDPEPEFIPPEYYVRLRDALLDYAGRKPSAAGVVGAKLQEVAELLRGIATELEQG